MINVTKLIWLDVDGFGFWQIIKLFKELFAWTELKRKRFSSGNRKIEGKKITRKI